MSDCFHSESENCKFQMYRFNAEDPGQSLYTPTTVGVIKHWKTQGRRSCSGQGGHGPCMFLLLITSTVVGVYRDWPGSSALNLYI